MTQALIVTFDEIVRIYKNAASGVIGIHAISLIEHRTQIPSHIPGKVLDNRFKRTASTSIKFSRFNLVLGESRVIAKIQMIGKYDDFTYNGSVDDIIAVKYNGDSYVNELEIGLKDLPTIGDTL